MEAESPSRAGPWLLVGAIAVAVGFALFYPPFRLVLLLSVPLGVLVTLILRWWYKRKPVELPEEQERKTRRPLGLDE